MIDTQRFLGAFGLVLVTLGAASCYGTDGGSDDDDAGGASGRGGSSTSGGRSSGGNSAAGDGGESGSPVGVGGTRGGSSAGGSGAGGSAGTTGASGGSGGTSDPVCDDADANGFFSDCSACGDDCDTIDDGSSTRNACGCSSGCPCGLSCGCYDIAPNVGVCDICVR